MEKSVGDAILEELSKLLAEENISDSQVGRETVLLNSGLDSMAFAILVARLEMKFGVDPFSLHRDPVYPETLGELIDFYEQTLNSIS